MLLNKFEMPLDLRLKPSRFLQYYFYILFTLAAVSIFISSLTFLVKLILFVLLILFSILQYKKLLSCKITGLSVKADDSWEIATRTNEVISAELYGECIVTHFLVWLNFKSLAGNKYHLLLLNDSTDKEQLRLLRVRLRF